MTQAIDLNEQLHEALIQHDALLSVRPTSTVASCINDEQEEEDAERLYLRYDGACTIDADFRFR